MMFAPTQLDKAGDVWIKLVSNQPGLEWAAWLAWFVSLSVVVVILCVFYYFYFVRKDLKFLKLAVFSGAVVTVLAELLKRIFTRLRPDGSDLFSFPSRHAALAFLLAYLVIQQNPKSKIRWLLVPWAIAVAFSRIWLEQHYVSDILAGAVIGIITGFFAIRYFKTKSKKRNN